MVREAFKSTLFVSSWFSGIHSRIQRSFFDSGGPPGRGSGGPCGRLARLWRVMLRCAQQTPDHLLMPWQLRCIWYVRTHVHCSRLFYFVWGVRFVSIIVCIILCCSLTRVNRSYLLALGTGVSCVVCFPPEVIFHSRGFGAYSVTTDCIVTKSKCENSNNNNNDDDDVQPWYRNRAAPISAGAHFSAVQTFWHDFVPQSCGCRSLIAGRVVHECGHRTIEVP